ncbi:CASP-like protein 4D1 isoform X1 [Camellia sinensis]|uniref:CASP-like protein 4D1 isoform X1 n=1 Tax=Camellia sinensis TaxID=4442 RepID=UPI001036B195|nr:CASP-like protein 4D1 isoform X1 [Camellia sinensis]
MAPPPSTVVSLVVTLMLRVLTFIFLLISLITWPPTTPSYLPISPRSRSDLVIFMLTMTGAAAGFGATIDLKSVLEGNGSSLDPFFNKGNAAASLLLLGFLGTAVLSILSSLALPKRGY